MIRSRGASEKRTAAYAIERTLSDTERLNFVISTSGANSSSSMIESSLFGAASVVGSLDSKCAAAHNTGFPIGHEMPTAADQLIIEV